MMCQTSVCFAQYINQNHFQSIPPIIGKLKSLKSFRAGQNQIGPLLDSTLFESPTLQQNLVQLWLYNNYIKELPANFDKLVALTDIKVCFFLCVLHAYTSNLIVREIILPMSTCFSIHIKKSISV